MNNKFAKILELANGAQVLLVKEKTKEDKVFVVIRTDVNDIGMSSRIQFVDDDKASAYMNDFTMSNAARFYSDATKFAVG